MARSRDQRKRSNQDKSAAQNSNKQVPYESIVKKNANFEAYYKQLRLIDENEFDDFMNILKAPLPITFRITSYKSFARDLLKILKENYFKYLDEITKGDAADKVIEASANKGASLLNQMSNDSFKLGDSNEIYKCLSWYPNEFAWQINLSRQDVKKNVHFEEFKQFLIHQTDNGNISRQEAVSMIPPLLLDVMPEHKILDMCASPGSKTAQLIEYLHQDATNPTPDGFVIANDLDNKRCYMLMHQLKRLESPNFMIINHDASSMPNFRVGVDSTQNILFDRILADVPCSGDGTFRKNIDIWTKWNFSHACNLHGIQSRIARRAFELLQYNGLMVYSTCSLNPVENEAVVYNLLLKYKNQLELVDSRHQLTGLKTVEGLLTWNLMGKNGELYENVQQVKPEFANLMRPYMFPPELHVAQELQLNKCIRVLPHHNNTGGFFIAVLRKLPPKLSPGIDSSLGSNVAEPAEKLQQAPETAKTMKAAPAKRVTHTFDENPFQFMEESTNQLLNDWPKIKEFFCISDDFPVSQMMTRNRKGENVKNVYFVSKQIKELTTNNGDRFKFINMGVPLFSKAEIKDPSNIDLRICQESLDIMLKYFHRRIVVVKKYSDILKILSESNPSLNQLSNELQQQINEHCQGLYGSLILTTKYDGLDKEDDEINRIINKDKERKDLTISFTAWFGKTSLRPLININHRRFLLTLCGVERTTIEKHCEQIKAEDKINSQKSLEKNPQYKAKLEGAKVNEDENGVDALGNVNELISKDENLIEHENDHNNETVKKMKIN